MLFYGLDHGKKIIISHLWFALIFTNLQKTENASKLTYLLLAEYVVSHHKTGNMVVQGSMWQLLNDEAAELGWFSTPIPPS